MSNPPKNASLDGLYMAVGKAISSWAAIEMQLHQIFAISTSLVAMQPGGGFSYSASIPWAVLDSIDGFRPKLLMIDAAMDGALRGLSDPKTLAIKNSWAARKDKVYDLHWNRSALAHWTAELHRNPDGTPKRALLKPPPYSSREHQGVTESDIKGWDMASGEEHQKLAKLVELLASHRRLQCRFVRLVANQIECSLPSDRYLLEFLKQQLSGHL